MTLFDGSQRRQIPALAIVIYLLILTQTKEMNASGIFSAVNVVISQLGKKPEPEISLTPVNMEFSCCCRSTEAFKNYLSKVLRSHTEQACDGSRVKLHCPRDTTISIQSAFYGRKVPSSLLCPSLNSRNTVEENLNCTAPTTLQKILDECQDQQSCQVLVNRQVFGLDPCPGTSKYLLVSYKCKPKEYKSKLACEGKELKIRCRNSALINIYSATYGRMSNGNHACPSNLKLPNIECLSHSALEVVATSCYGKQNCKIVVSSHYFGDPCLPGMQKYLSVIYICGNPEMVGLLFVSSVCIGLIFTLCAIVIQVSCRVDMQKTYHREMDLPETYHRKMDCCQDNCDIEDNNHSDEDVSTNDDDDDEESSSDFTFEGLTKFYGTPRSNSAEAAEIAERIERRDRIIQEIWMNGGSEVPVIRNFNQYY
ncbi:protein eva-1 homolog C isoform X6 [Mobula birostris]|uniref:protein eva-1 homolog C isoform X6 n=1 Tax=Mobula birostris TaxID=1983395 RepID=UPI003B27CF37